MSTKTTFKRIALVAVAALGLGVLSVAPSSAIASGTTVTVANGTATTQAAAATIDSDTTTGASITVTSLLTSAADSVTVAFYQKSIPSTQASQSALLSLVETGTIATRVAATASTASFTDEALKAKGVTRATNAAAAAMTIASGGGNSATYGNVSAKFSLFLETGTTAALGTYTYTVVTTTYNNNSTGTAAAGAYTITTQTNDVSIVVSTNATQAAAASKTPSAAGATAFIGSSSGPTSDSAVSAVATADSVDDGHIRIKLNNTNGTAGVAEDSVTASVTGAGLVCASATCGKTLLVALTSGQLDLTLRGDGTAGVSTVALSTPTVSLGTKSITYYAKAAKTLTAAVRVPVLKVGANTGAVSVAATDASGIAWTGAAYIYASSAADALIAGSETPAACSWTADTGIRCDITGKLVGTAKFKVIDASTVALATATSNEITVTVAAGSPGSVKLSFDKSTYAPFEKAKITVTVLDTTGKGLPAQTIANVFAAGGITSTVGFSANSETLTATSVVLADANSATTGAVAGSQVYYVYMPAGSGDVTISATGSTGLALAGQVAVSATATVVNASVDAATDAANEATDAANAATDAALAAADAADAATAAAQDASDAVAALSATVAKLVASLKAQIQKKVRA
jgi:hypothetical protein